MTSKCATFLQNHSHWDQLCDLICQLHNQTPNDGIDGLKPVDLVLAHPPDPILADTLHVPEGIPPTAQEFAKLTKERIKKVDTFVRTILHENHVRNNEYKNRTATLTPYHLDMTVALHCPTITNKSRKT